MEDKEKPNVIYFNLSGKELPSDWPEIISFEEHNRIVREATNEQLSISLKHPSGKELEYLAVTHSQQPDHPQFDEIERRFDATTPDVVLYEGQQGDPKFTDSTTREEVIKSYGESGFIKWLAYKKDIQTRSLDIQYDDWIDGFRKQGYSNEEIAAFHTARVFYSHAEEIRQEGYDLDKIESEEYFLELIPDLEKLPRDDGQEWTFNLMNEEYRKLTGTELSFASNNAKSETKYVNVMSKIFEDQQKFREVYMIEQITQALRSQNKVFAAAGSAHPVRQRKALEQFMQ